VSLQTSKVSREASEATCAAFFAKTATAGPLDAGERHAMVEAVVDVLSIGNDQRIPMPARPSAHLHLLIDGWALRSHTLPDGARSITDVMLPGDFCDAASTKARNAGQDLRACGSARIAVLRKDVFDGAALPTLSRSWRWVRDTDAQALRFRLVSLGRKNARARVAHLMSELHHRVRRAGLSDGNAFECPLTQEQLADVLGLTPVHVNRVLQCLRREGLIVFKRPHVVIPALARLHLAAGFDEGTYNVDLGD
jgi:CRP-like cAMP-binding protein